MPSHDTVIDMATTITILHQLVEQKEQHLQESQKRVEYLQNQLAQVLEQEVQGKQAQ